MKWIDAGGFIVRLPIATISTLLLGPGTSITHEAVKVLSSANTTVCWVGEDSLLFYAISQSPTSDTRKMRRQIELATNPSQRLVVARRLFAQRFPDENIESLSISELMGKEGLRVRESYEAYAKEYGVGWVGRRFVPGQFHMSDTTNKILTAANAALYSLVLSAIISTGLSPHVGFIHTGSPLPFVYDISDLYKDKLCVSFAFRMTAELGCTYDRKKLLNRFRECVSEFCLMERLPNDLSRILGE